jgi:hypothetical protein
MKDTPIAKDWLFLGFITGVAASVAKSAVNIALNNASIPTTPYSSMAAGVVLGKRSKGQIPKAESSQKSGSYKEKAIGHLGDIILGGLFGSALSFVYSQTPPRRMMWKGAIGGTALWITTLAAGQLLRLEGANKTSPGEMASLLGTHIIYGMLQGALIEQLRKATAIATRESS